jgi:hypothetical protein
MRGLVGGLYILAVPGLVLAHVHLYLYARKSRWLINEIRAFLIKTAATSTFSKKLGNLDSPWTASAELVGAFQALQFELESFYESRGQNLTDTELYWQIYLCFGERLAKLIAVPNKLELGEAVLGAVYVAKGQQPVETGDIGHGPGVKEW